jgi:hypothetical protein
MTQLPTEQFLDAFWRLDMQVDVLQADFVAMHNSLILTSFRCENRANVLSGG